MKPSSMFYNVIITYRYLGKMLLIISTSPLVRTNPVTGWKSLFSILQSGRINGVTDREDEILKAYCQLSSNASTYTRSSQKNEVKQLFVENHDLQVRIRWSKDDIAIWDE